MKVLYAAYRHDPRNPDLASGSDYNFYHAMKRSGMEVKVLGPILNPAHILERGVMKLYWRQTGMKYAKFPVSLMFRASAALNRMEKRWKPDVVFTIFPLYLALYRGQAPAVYRLDTSFVGWQRSYPEFGKLAFRLTVWQEARGLRRTARVITHSEWAKAVLVQAYGVDPDIIRLFPNPSALPEHVVPDDIEIVALKRLEQPLRLLLVGRDEKRKGVDAAIEIVRRLNARGVPAVLTVCGVSREDGPNVRFVGPYKKSDPQQLLQYVTLYRRAHLLLHPALFEAAGIVPSEAAAFGTPTITNATGGLATTVTHNESGIVLEKGSPPEAYVEAIVNLVNNPEAYYALCRTARQRYDRELNWQYAGERVASILHELVSDAGSQATA